MLMLWNNKVIVFGMDGLLREQVETWKDPTFNFAEVPWVNIDHHEKWSYWNFWLNLTKETHRTIIFSAMWISLLILSVDFDKISYSRTPGNNLCLLFTKFSSTVDTIPIISVTYCKNWKPSNFENFWNGNTWLQILLQSTSLWNIIRELLRRKRLNAIFVLAQ